MAQGLQVALITGDNKVVAAKISAELGIMDVVAEVPPAGKVAALEALRAQGQLAFVATTSKTRQPVRQMLALPSAPLG